MPPRQTYPVGSTVQGWERRETTDNGATVVRRLEVDEHGRIIVAEGRSMDGSGVVRGASRQVAGLLAVYEPGAVPAAVFARSQHAQAGCRD